MPAVGAHRCPRNWGGYEGLCLACWQFGDCLQGLLLAFSRMLLPLAVVGPSLIDFCVWLRDDGRPDGRLQRGSYRRSAAPACLACSHCLLVAWVGAHTQCPSTRYRDVQYILPVAIQCSRTQALRQLAAGVPPSRAIIEAASVVLAQPKVTSSSGKRHPWDSSLRSGPELANGQSYRKRVQRWERRGHRTGFWRTRRPHNPSGCAQVVREHIR